VLFRCPTGKGSRHLQHCLGKVSRCKRREIDACDADEPFRDQPAVLSSHFELVPEAARIFDGAGDADTNGLTGANWRTIPGRRLDARHAERQFVEQRLPGPAKRCRKEFLLRIFEPTKKIWEPDDAGRVGVGPMHFLLHPEKSHGRV